VRKLIVIRDPDEVVPTLRREMKAAGVTQTKLAQDMGMTLKHVNMMLRGKNGIKLVHLLTVCAHLDIGIAFYPKDPQSAQE
jgi:transcriptional regulator with XRE-family HTH domain